MGSNEKYDVNQLFVGSILTHIQDNEIVVPEIQRPFVWNASQVSITCPNLAGWHI